MYHILNFKNMSKELRQLFKNKSDCYVDTRTKGWDGNDYEGAVVQAMTEDMFVKVYQEQLKEEVIKVLKWYDDNAEMLAEHTTTYEEIADIYLKRK